MPHPPPNLSKNATLHGLPPQLHGLTSPPPQVSVKLGLLQVDHTDSLLV